MSGPTEFTRRRWLEAAGASLAATVLGSSGQPLGGASPASCAECGEEPMPSADAAPTIVDPHVHVWRRDPLYPFAADLKTPPADDALPDTLLKLMTANGVRHTVIVHVIYYKWDCRYTALAIKEHPREFQGVCRVDPQSPRAPEELDHWLEQGYHGVRLSPGAGPEGDWINDRAQMDRIWNRAAERNVPMCVLCPISRIPDVEAVIARHNGRLAVCIDHMADCPIDQPNELNKLLALARYPRVYVKLSHLWSLSREAYPYRDTHDQVKKLYDAFGPRRLMWGTDWPMVEQYCGYAKALALYRDEIKFFNDEDRRWILGGTALRLWEFGKDA
ncbi:MAG: amidohydrolase [Pirellulales bacterium]|nr:amidohydrolase [Pirellulales bacterium]